MLSELWCVMKGLAVAPPAIMLKIGVSICSKTDKREGGDGSGRRETKSKHSGIASCQPLLGASPSDAHL